MSQAPQVSASGAPGFTVWSERTLYRQTDRVPTPLREDPRSAHSNFASLEYNQTNIANFSREMIASQPMNDAKQRRSGAADEASRRFYSVNSGNLPN